ncbi:MAG: site-2 protease family protein [Pyrinomonadaceae bacterium]|nr:site-2 protease family protein [Pyrinomonadaceae bacterium]
MIKFVSRLNRFLKSRVLLGHASGIPVRIDYRWFIVLFILSWLVASSVPTGVVSSFLIRFLIGFSTVLIFFGTLFLHEFAHAFVARREGIDVLEIYLHPFGGVARLRREPETPGGEFRIAIAGPVASFLIAIFFLVFYALSSSLKTGILTPPFFLLFLLNLLLAVSNLFPGFPLDGGRVLRAILWRRGMELSDATRLTGKFGQIISFALVFFGVAVIGLSRDLFTGLWSIVVGVFLLDSATSFIKSVDNFENLVAGNVMEMPVSVSPEMTIMECVDRIMPFHNQTIFPAAIKRELFGFLVLEDVRKEVPKEKWREALVRDVMRPVREDYFVESSRPVVEARILLRENGLGVLGVIDGRGKLVGIMRRGKIRRRN